MLGAVSRSLAGGVWLGSVRMRASVGRLSFVISVAGGRGLEGAGVTCGAVDAYPLYSSQPLGRREGAIRQSVLSPPAEHFSSVLSGTLGVSSRAPSCERKDVMPWVPLDDKFHSNPKVIAAGLEAAGLYARSLSYCGDHLTDGHIPKGWAEEVAPRRARAKLIETKLWVEENGGFKIPHYLDFNPNREVVLRKREEAAERARKRRESS